MNNFILKLIAIVVMFIDHFAVASYRMIGLEKYKVLRAIGRTSFPIFAFLLVEGFRNTRNRWRYLLSMLILACISEIPYDLVFATWELRHKLMNVFFTLSISLFVLIIGEEVRKGFNLVITSLVNITLMAISMYIAWKYNFDYGAFGPLLVYMIYYSAEIVMPHIKQASIYNVVAVLAIFMWFCIHDIYYNKYDEVNGFPACILLYFYNHQRGKYIIPKYVFYFFYPVHLMLLYFLRKYYFNM